MLCNIAEQKDKIDAILGVSNTVTDHATFEVLQFMAYQSDKIKYENKLTEIIRNKK